MITSEMVRPGASGSFERQPTQRRFRPVQIVVPSEASQDRPLHVDPSRLPAEVVSRQRRAPPPIEDDYDLLGYLLLTLLFLAVVW